MSPSSHQNSLHPVRSSVMSLRRSSREVAQHSQSRSRIYYGCPVFPLEVFEWIMELIKDSRDTTGGWGLGALAACALTCRAWQTKATSLLYRSVLLQRDRDLDSFLFAIKTNPEWMDFINELIIDTNEKFMSWHTIFIQTSPNRPFGNLRKLSIYANESSNQHAIHPRSFRSLAAYKSVTQLTLLGVGFDSFRPFVDIISSFPQLQILWLRGCGILKKTYTMSLLPRRKHPRIRWLHLGDNECYDGEYSTLGPFQIRWMVSSGGASHLSSLFLSPRNTASIMTYYFNRLLQSLGETLKELELGYDSGDIDIQHNTHLEYLQFDAGSPLKLKQILSTLTSDRLSNLAIDLQANRTDKLTSELAELDSCFSNPRLESCSIELILRQWQSKPITRERILSTMPLFRDHPRSTLTI